MNQLSKVKAYLKKKPHKKLFTDVFTPFAEKCGAVGLFITCSAVLCTFAN